MTTLALPGVVPVHLSPYSDPVYFGAGELSPTVAVGDGTLYHFPTTRSGHVARAWKLRGFETFEFSGSVALIRRDLTEPGDYVELAAVGFADTLSLFSLPPAVSWGKWAAVVEGATPIRDPDLDPVRRASNPDGIVETEARVDLLDLHWMSPFESDAVEISSTPTGETAWDGSGWVTFDFVVRATFRGNSGLLKDESGQYRSLVQFDLSAGWERSDRLPFSGTYTVDELPDADEFYLAETASLSTNTTAVSGDHVTEEGAVSFEGGSGTNADVAFSNEPAIYNITGPQGGLSLLPVWSISTLAFRDPFFWTPPAAL